MTRARHLRKTAAIRALVRETRISGDDLVQPFFVVEGRDQRQPIAAMPGMSRFSLDLLPDQVEAFIRAGGKAGLLFGLPSFKDAQASGAVDADGLIPCAVRLLKQQFPDFLLITDVCLCAYTDHGHCGVITDGQVDNDRSLPLLARMAAAHAAAGADFVAPSDMMDFRVRAIRTALDNEGLEGAGILSYAVKYASSYYGPFREAADSAPSFGDRRNYQMDPANAREALKEARQDVSEGADILMVKPALAYLDVVRRLRADLAVPLAVYNVSGEYAMVKAAAERGWIDERAIVLENLTSFKRAGADIIITYHAQDALKWIAENQ